MSDRKNPLEKLIALKVYADASHELMQHFDNADDVLDAHYPKDHIANFVDTNLKVQVWYNKTHDDVRQVIIQKIIDMEYDTNFCDRGWIESILRLGLGHEGFENMKWHEVVTIAKDTGIVK